MSHIYTHFENHLNVVPTETNIHNSEEATKFDHKLGMFIIIY